MVGSAEERNNRTSYLSDSWRTAQRGSPLRQRADVFSPPRLKIFARVVHLKRDWPVHSPLRIDTTPLRSARAHLSITLLVTLPPLLLLLLLHREERAAISGSHIRLAARPSSLRRSSTIFKYSGPLVERASSSTATELVG